MLTFGAGFNEVEAAESSTATISEDLNLNSADEQTDLASLPVEIRIGGKYGPPPPPPPPRRQPPPPPRRYEPPPPKYGTPPPGHRQPPPPPHRHGW